ncbi:TPA: hypothetical protein AB5A35_001014 [Vibrio cholerae]
MAIKIITACVTDYGSKLSGYPSGTILSFSDAKHLSSGKPEQGLFVANWHVGNANLISFSVRQALGVN